MIENHPSTLILGKNDASSSQQKYDDTEFLNRMFSKDTDLKHLYDTNESAMLMQNMQKSESNALLKSSALPLQHKRSNSNESSHRALVKTIRNKSKDQTNYQSSGRQDYNYQ